jgi:hypothetical protein
VEVALAAVFHHRDVGLHDRDLRARQLLEVGERPGMIAMAVPIDQNLDVLRVKTKFADRFDNHRTGIGHAGVEQDVSILGREEVGGEAGRPDVVQRPDDLGRLRRQVPLEGLARERQKQLVVSRQVFLGRVGRRLLRRRRSHRHAEGDGRNSRQTDPVATRDVRNAVRGTHDLRSFNCHQSRRFTPMSNTVTSARTQPTPAVSNGGTE